MAKLSVRERLLKRKDDVLKVEVRLDEETVVVVHEISSDRLEELRQLCKKDGKINQELLDALMLIESVHETDGTRALSPELKQELGILNDVEFVNLAYRYGEQKRLDRALAEALGFIEPEEAKQEAVEVKN